jgi:hypothetical protein
VGNFNVFGWSARILTVAALLVIAGCGQEELHSLANEGRGSPFYPNMEKQKDAISADMQEMSKPILEQLVTEALTNAFKDR